MRLRRSRRKRRRSKVAETKSSLRAVFQASGSARHLTLRRKRRSLMFSNLSPSSHHLLKFQYQLLRLNHLLPSLLQWPPMTPSQLPSQTHCSRIWHRLQAQDRNQIPLLQDPIRIQVLNLTHFWTRLKEILAWQKKARYRLLARFHRLRVAISLDNRLKLHQRLNHKTHSVPLLRTQALASWIIVSNNHHLW